MLNILLRLITGNLPQTLTRTLGADVASAGGLKSLVTGKSDATSENFTIDPRIKAHYEQHIKPQTDIFEANRVATLTILRKRLLILAPIALAALVFGLLGAGVPEGEFSLMELLGTLAMFAAFAVGAWAALPVIQYKGSIKDKIFSNVFRFFGPEWQYNPKGLGGGLDLNALSNGGLKGAFSEIKRAGDEHAANSPKGWHRGSEDAIMKPYMPFGILPPHEDAHTEDYVRGSHKDVPLSLFECRLTSENGSGKNRSTTTHFEGVIITIDVPKRFAGHTVVKRDAGKVGNWFSKQFKGELKPITLEDPRFEKRYEVFGTDQVEGRYLLNPAFMERLVELEDLFAADNHGRCDIQCAFKDGKLLFTIPTSKNWFSTGSIFKPANFIGEINAILKEMDQLFAIIDVLKLDDRTGL